MASNARQISGKGAVAVVGRNAVVPAAASRRAAVRTASGTVYTGGNIENGVFGLTVCAERVAIWKAISAGDRDLRALAVVTDTGATPCGSCRQVMAEFAEELPVVIAATDGRAWRTSLAELLPHAFPRTNLSGRPELG